MYLKNDDGFPLVVASVTVDDCLLGGKPKDLKEIMDKVKKKFKITREDEVKRHLGIDYYWKRDEQGEIYLETTMEKRAAGIVATYEKHIGGKVKEFDTPGAPRSVLGANEGVVVNIDVYRSLVGKLMFYTTKIGPKQANAVRDLSRHLSIPGDAHWDVVKRVIGFVKVERHKNDVTC